MPRADFVRNCPVKRTPRVMQLEGMFDLPPVERTERSWSVDLPLADHDWQIGLIVGPSGSGKSSLLSELFPRFLFSKFPEWDRERSIVDCFAPELPVTEITEMLSSVGFSSPPSWLQPYHTLSTGEQFRVDVARRLLEAEDIAVIDEFTSVVDRTVARIGSAAIAKHVRRYGKKLVAATCHYDVIDWLQPDWVYDVHTDTFRWECLLRPSIELEVYRTSRDAWRIFGRHHYLNASVSAASHCFVGLFEGEPAVFVAVLAQPHARSPLPIFRAHRTVVLPDFQGVSIGNKFGEFVASLYVAAGCRYTSVTSHPAMIGYRARSPLWTMTRKVSNSPKESAVGSLMDGWRTSSERWTASFEYVGPACDPQFDALIPDL